MSMIDTGEAITMSNVAPLSSASRGKGKATFKKGDVVVLPAHGLGNVESIVEIDFDNIPVTLVGIAFVQERLSVSIPLDTARVKGLRHVGSAADLLPVYKRLLTKIRQRRTMWSRRATEYDAKINSGSMLSVAEVVRELHRTPEQEEASYSERVLYNTAVERLGREIAAIEKISFDDALERIKEHVERPSNPKVAAAA